MQENEIVNKLQLVFPGQLIAYTCKGEMIHCNSVTRMIKYLTLKQMLYRLSINIKKKKDYGAFLTSNPYNDLINIHACLCLF